MTSSSSPTSTSNRMPVSPDAGPTPYVGCARQYDNGAIVCSVCSGSLMLAEAGLLDGREATSHWSARPFFQRCYPRVLLRAERVLVPSGAGHRIVTSGGSMSWTDLALYLIARFCGDVEARHIAKIFLLGDRRDGQLPFAAMVRPPQHEDAIIADAQVWIADNYATANPVATMVARARLTDRTFKRRFRAATGYAPLEYVQSLRIEEAKQILETTTTAIDDVALTVGYDEPKLLPPPVQTPHRHQPEAVPAEVRGRGVDGVNGPALRPTPRAEEIRWLFPVCPARHKRHLRRPRKQVTVTGFPAEGTTA